MLLTHGHADHMDRRSLELLCEQADREIVFIVPLRLSRWLPKACRQVIELSWWESVRIDGVEFMLVPAQHWHRRGLTDEDECLWGGYVARGSCSLYHSGDTAYFGGFGAIGSVAPGLDVACLPLGAYEPRWLMQGQHMAPEQSLAAFRELGARSFVGMHWGTYDLSDEAIDAGPEILQRVSQNDDASSAESVYVVRPGGVLGFGAGQAPCAYGRLGGDESAPRRRGTPSAAVKSAAAHDSRPPSSPSNA